MKTKTPAVFAPVSPTQGSPTGLTLAEVESADHEQLCRWWRFLPSMRVGDPVSDRLVQRLKDLGGMTPEISKRIGWEA